MHIVMRACALERRVRTVDGVRERVALSNKLIPAGDVFAVRLALPLLAHVGGSAVRRKVG